MIISLIKYFVFIICSSYLSYRFLNCSVSRSWLFIASLCIVSVVNSLIVCILRQYIPEIAILGMVGLSIAVHTFLYKIDLSRAIIATILAYGVCYLFYLLAIALLVVGLLIMNHPMSETNLLITVIISLFQMSFSLALFQIKRLRHGLPFLRDSKYGDIGVYLSVSVLMVASFLGIQPESNYSTLILCCIILICGIFLWLWWKDRMTKKYMEQIRQREQQELQAKISSLNHEITALKEENETFSKIIHKDNKLLPAMELAVRETLYDVAQNGDPAERICRTEEILAQLEAVSRERAGIVSNYEHPTPALPQIGIPALDILFSYMAQKATVMGIAFALRFDSGVAEALPAAISIEDASTLLADLIENALIAVSGCSGEKRVHAVLGLENGHCFISICDTGEPFPQEIIQNWGIRRITTHAETGGSGIGLMSTFEICKRYHADFCIDSSVTNPPYTKCVSVRFDGSEAFEVKTTHGEIQPLPS